MNSLALRSMMRHFQLPKIYRMSAALASVRRWRRLCVTFTSYLIEIYFRVSTLSSGPFQPISVPRDAVALRRTQMDSIIPSKSQINIECNMFTRCTRYSHPHTHTHTERRWEKRTKFPNFSIYFVSARRNVRKNNANN